MASQNALSRELALRIGLAARALPDTEAKTLFKVLISCVGLPLTEDRLASLNLAQLKTAEGDILATIDDGLINKALAILLNQETVDSILPQQVETYRDGDMPGSVRIACASDDGSQVDGHFGSCNQFLIYQVSGREARLIDIRNTAIPTGLEVHDKNSFRAELIQDCQVLYMASVGGPAAAKIVKLGIHPIKLPTIESIADIISQLQTVIAGTPPPWLAKVMGIAASDRFRFEREALG